MGIGTARWPARVAQVRQEGSVAAYHLSSRHARLADEGSQHTVAFSEPFAVSKYELTFADWDASHRWRRRQWLQAERFRLGARAATGDRHRRRAADSNSVA